MANHLNDSFIVHGLLRTKTHDLARFLMFVVICTQKLRNIFNLNPILNQPHFRPLKRNLLYIFVLRFVHECKN
jgi:hypothetical protein